MKLSLTYWGRDREQLWSGTFDVFDKLLSKNDKVAVLEWIRIFPDIPTIYQKILTLYSRLFYTANGICREKQMYGLTRRRALREIERSQSQWVLMVAEHCLTGEFPKDKKYACYIDTDFPIVAQYDAAKSKTGFDYYIKNYDKYTRESYQNMNIIFTQNEWTRRSIIERFALPDEKVVNVRFGVNIEPYNGIKNYDNELLLIVLRPFNAKIKGLDILIEALPKIRKAHPHARLAIVGNDQYKDIEGVDCYVGFPREKTKELFREACLYVMPSRCEPNGMTYLEALMNKVPFVAFNRFATPEFSNNGEWSFLCTDESADDVADTVIKALDDKERLVSMGSRGQQFVMENYNWEKTIDLMLTKMEEL